MTPCREYLMRNNIQPQSLTGVNSGNKAQVEQQVKDFEAYRD